MIGVEDGCHEACPVATRSFVGSHRAFALARIQSTTSCSTQALGILGGVAFERWRAAGIQAVPQAIAAPVQVAEPSSSAESIPKKATPANPRDRRRASPAPNGHDIEPPHGTVMEQGSNSGGPAKGTDDAKPKA
jgi:hypothetical protein